MWGGIGIHITFVCIHAYILLYTYTRTYKCIVYVYVYFPKEGVDE